MGKRHSLWGVLLYFLLAVGPALAEPPTAASLNALGVPTIRKVLTGSHGNVSEVLPEYNPQTDFLFHFYPDGHAVFYSGGDFRESGEEAPREGLRAIHQGVSVKVTVGPERVQQILAAMKTVQFSSIKNIYTCQQRILFMLQEVGILMKQGPYLLGSTTYRSMMENGFVDGAGTSFPYAVVALESEGSDLIEANFRKMMRYEVGTEHGFFAGLRNHLGYGDVELRADVASATNNPTINNWVGAMTVGTHNVWSEQEIDMAYDVVKSGEKRFLDRLQAHFGGAPLNVLYQHLTRMDLPPEYLAGARLLFRQSMQEAIQAKVAEIEPTPALEICARVNGAAANP